MRVTVIIRNYMLAVKYYRDWPILGLEHLNTKLVCYPDPHCIPKCTLKKP